MMTDQKKSKGRKSLNAFSRYLENIEETNEEKGTVKLPKVNKHGRLVVNPNQMQIVDDMVNDIGLLKGERMRSAAKKSKIRKNMGDRICFKISIDPDRLIARPLHSYKCSCGNIAHKCRDLATMLDPEVAVVQRMVDECEEREDAVVRKNFLPFLQHEDLISLRRREILHKRWTENVYRPLHKKVIDQLQGPHYDAMQMTRHMMYVAYLEHRNVKKDIFLDEIVDTPKGYRYVQPDRRWLHARTRPLVDPTCVTSRKQEEEDRFLLTIDDTLDSAGHWLPPVYADQPGRVNVSWVERAD